MFIGGLIRNTATDTRKGVTTLGDIPLIGVWFSNRGRTSVNTETIILITPHVVETEQFLGVAHSIDQAAKVDDVFEQVHELDRRAEKIQNGIDKHPLSGIRPPSVP